MIGVDRAKMKLYDLEESAQKNLTDSNIDNSRVDTPTKEQYNMLNKRRDFSSIKV
jgi:aminoglycoside phosphotransferase